MLSQLGIRFQSISANVEEIHLNGEKPESFAQRMAEEKAQDVAHKHPGNWTIGADTVITIDGTSILGKPANEQEAFSILRQLSGRTHQVITGFCICSPQNEIKFSQAETTQVTFTHVSDDLIYAYIATGEPMDKAGAYGIQGLGSVLVSNINGSCSNVIGLPLSSLISQLISLQVITPAR